MTDKAAEMPDKLPLDAEQIERIEKSLFDLGPATKLAVSMLCTQALAALTERQARIAAENDAKHVRQSNANYREENRIATERAEALQSRLDELREALSSARDALFNGFEPDNQSKAWHKANAALGAPK